MEPVNITICGTPSPQTLTDLFAIAMRDGLGFVLPPRLMPTATPAVAVEAPVERRKLPGRTAPAARATPAKSEPAIEPTGRASLPDAQAARERRDAIVGQLRRVGESGLSFKGLLTACRSVLATTGNEEQQVNALRNAMTILQRDGRVKRFAGQWIAVSDGD